MSRSASSLMYNVYPPLILTHLCLLCFVQSQTEDNPSSKMDLSVGMCLYKQEGNVFTALPGPWHLLPCLG
jgi:hypothetical protein